MRTSSGVYRPTWRTRLFRQTRTGYVVAGIPRSCSIQGSCNRCSCATDAHRVRVRRKAVPSPHNADARRRSLFRCSSCMLSGGRGDLQCHAVQLRLVGQAADLCRSSHGRAAALGARHRAMPGCARANLCRRIHPNEGARPNAYKRMRIIERVLPNMRYLSRLPCVSSAIFEFLGKTRL